MYVVVNGDKKKKKETSKTRINAFHRDDRIHTEVHSRQEVEPLLMMMKTVSTTCTDNNYCRM